MIFETQVRGIKCQCRVVSYKPYVPATRDAEAMPSEFEFELLDTQGMPYWFLEAKMTDEDMDRLQDEYEAIVKEKNSD